MKSEEHRNLAYVGCKLPMYTFGHKSVDAKKSKLPNAHPLGTLCEATGNHRALSLFPLQPGLTVCRACAIN